MEQRDQPQERDGTPPLDNVRLREVGGVVASSRASPSLRMPGLGRAESSTGEELVAGRQAARGAKTFPGLCGPCCQSKSHGCWLASPEDWSQEWGAAVAQWQSACWACRRSQVQSPVAPPVNGLAGGDVEDLSQPESLESGCQSAKTVWSP
ncbi:UNVERIFIED_CONTAM: hypothetical protein K2H54_046881 [Gekko kuhli]